jgi:CHRD domain
MRMLRRLVLLSLAVGLIVAACGDDNPSGPAPRRFTAALNGANERPDTVNTTATGTMTMTVPAGSNQMTWALNITGWPAGVTPTLAHIHRGGPNEAAGFFVNFNPQFTVSGQTVTASGTVAVPDSLFTLVAANRAYVNVHSSRKPAGEIRGQVVQQ